MKKVLLGVAGFAAVVVVGFVAAVSSQPSELRVERSKVVAAAPEDVWPYVSDLRKFTGWSPWEDRDPNQVAEFSDPSHGVGAWYTWAGNDDVGSGKMSIRSLEENRQVVEDLEFIEPFASRALVTLSLEPVEGGSRVTWGFVSENDFMGKAFGMFVDMDEMLGADFAKGLDRLAPLAEAARRERVEAARAAEAAAAEVAVEAAAP